MCDVLLHMLGGLRWIMEEVAKKHFYHAEQLCPLGVLHMADVQRTCT